LRRVTHQLQRQRGAAPGADGEGEGRAERAEAAAEGADAGGAKAAVAARERGAGEGGGEEGSGGGGGGGGSGTGGAAPKGARQQGGGSLQHVGAAVRCRCVRFRVSAVVCLRSAAEQQRAAVSGAPQQPMRCEQAHPCFGTAPASRMRPAFARSSTRW